MQKSLVNKKTIGIDTNIFIYYFANTSEFYNEAKAFFEYTILHKREFITSSLSIAELLSFQAQEPMIAALFDNLLQLPNLKIYSMDTNIAKEAARIRRLYRYSLSDAIQLATALYAKADVFVTNDKRLRSFKEIAISSLDI